MYHHLYRAGITVQLQMFITTAVSLSFCPSETNILA